MASFNGLKPALQTGHCTETPGGQHYDTVRAAFWEGGELFPGSGFHGADHTQICVRNLDCALGYFRPL